MRGLNFFVHLASYPRTQPMLETRQLHPTLAREVVDLRLWEQLGDATIAELRTL